MQRATLGKNKSEFLDGALSLPNDFEPAHKYWQRCNNLVLSWIFNSGNSSIAQSITFKDNAHNMVGIKRKIPSKRSNLNFRIK